MNETIPINTVKSPHTFSIFKLQITPCKWLLSLLSKPSIATRTNSKIFWGCTSTKDCKSTSLKTYFERETYIILKHTVTIHMSFSIIQYISSIIIEDEVLFELEARARRLQILGSFSNLLLLLVSIVVKM